MRYVIVDLEATCWAGGEQPRDDMETIEICAMLLAGVTGPVAAVFGVFVRPVVHPLLDSWGGYDLGHLAAYADLDSGFANR